MRRPAYAQDQTSLTEREADLHDSDGIVNIVVGASALPDVTVDDRILIFFGAVVGGFERGAATSFEMHVFVVVMVLEVAETLLGLEFKVALSVLVAGVGTGLAAGDEVGHGCRVIRRLFRLVRLEAPDLRLQGCVHGRHARFIGDH